MTTPDIQKSLQSALAHHKAFQSALEHHRAGRLDEAKAICEQLRQVKPDHHRALHLLGLIANQEGEFDSAIKLIKRAVQIAPSNPEYQYNLGIVFGASGKLDEAITCYQWVLVLKPDDVETLNNLGNSLKERGQPDEAIACYRKSLTYRPNDAMTLNNLGIALKGQGKLDEAVACYQQSLAIKPDDAGVIKNMGNALKEQGRIDEAMACYQRSLAVRGDDDRAHNSKLLAAHYTTIYMPEELFAEHQKFATQFETPLKKFWRPHSNSRDPEKRLKIGYVSPDFRNHAVAYFMGPVFDHHDKSRVEVFCYYNHIQHDSYTDRIRARADHWVPCTRLTDEQLAEKIRADGIDILVDLAGHTGGNRLLVFARKPAPVQVTYLGYIHTTGLSAIDYRLTHVDADPPGSERYYSETLYRLPGNFWWCYRPRPDMPEVAPPPALVNGFVTFGSTNAFSKMSPETIIIWAAILSAVSTARLLIIGVPEGSARQLLAERFAAQGVDSQRLILQGRVPVTQFWALHQQIDIVLDPFPHNGGTTTCDALWLGVPVVTLTGQVLVSRMGYALLKNLSLPELVATDTQGYVDIAVGLADDLERLKALRSSMRTRLAASSLRDESGFTQTLETAYREMWWQWCNEQSKP